MLQNCNLQFTNATKLNDPFDCHPSLIDFSDVPADRCKIWPADIISLVEYSPYKRNWEETWICSLSLVYDSLLMWSYYSTHKGICIGLDRVKIKHNLSHISNGVHIGAEEIEIQYRDIIEKPNHYRNIHGRLSNYFRYQLSTKAKAWEHEQEVRLLLREPYTGIRSMDLPPNLKKKGGVLDIKDYRAYPHVSGECFCSLYLGIRIEKEVQEKIIQVARKCNPDINIYKMNIDSDAFRLKAEAI